MQNIFQELCEVPRPAGSERIKKIRQYITSLLKENFQSVEQKSYPFTGWDLLEPPKFSFIRPVEKVVGCIPVVWSGATDNELVGKVVPAFDTIKTFEAYAWQIYSVVNEENKVIGKLMTRPDMVWAQPLDNSNQQVPHLILDVEACKLINSWIAEKEEIEVRLCVKSQYMPNQEITNIIASSSQEEASIALLTHYDSMFNTVGAHDNASGTVALLKLVERLADINTEKLRFIFFDAEEWNKYGSYCYVNELKKNNVLNQIKLAINIDSVGVGDSIYCLTSPSIERDVKSVVTELEGFSDIKIDISSKQEFPQFDSWPFMKNGIPVIQIGTKGTPSFTYFHHPKDNMENIDYELMEKVIMFLEKFIRSLLEKELAIGG